MKLTVSEYAKRLNVSVQAIYQKLNKGTLESVEENGTKYVIVDKEPIKSVLQPHAKAVEQVSLKYLFKQLKIRDKKIECLENKIDKRDNEIKKLNKKLLQSSSSEKDTLLSFISELKQLQAPTQNYNIDEEVIEVNPKKKKKKSKK
jgi:excisionase family DNA binding protein